jgi:hypothetical protein
MLSYLFIGANDIDASAIFYDAILIPLGYDREVSEGQVRDVTQLGISWRFFQRLKSVRTVSKATASRLQFEKISFLSTVFAKPQEPMAATPNLVRSQKGGAPTSAATSLSAS